MQKIGVIGCGNMGEAILGGIISDKVVSAKDILVSDVDSAKLDSIKNKYKVDVTFNNSIVAKSSSMIIVAVKPQDMNSVLLGISECFEGKKFLVSIAAGVTIKKITSVIGGGVPVARAMPNMPALIRQGFSAVSFSKNTGKEDAEFAKKVFSCLGDVVEVKEKDLDTITAISGSGPAYFFYIVEMLIKTGTKLGMTKDIAKRAALKTALGSVELLNRSGEEPSLLRKKVTSKGGTTEAAFKVFKKRGLERIMQNGITAAKKRSKELSGG
jgi:pyrroline-5-carboxylate reductase